jgi:cation:H+ antiporter
MLVDIMWLIGGIFVLIKGADWLVAGGSSLAKRFNISELAIGLTIVAFGTSAPHEWFAKGYSLFQNQPDFVLGNMIGSNIFNFLFIISISSFIHPISFNPKFNPDLYFLAGARSFCS